MSDKSTFETTRPAVHSLRSKHARASSSEIIILRNCLSSFVEHYHLWCSHCSNGRTVEGQPWGTRSGKWRRTARKSSGLVPWRPNSGTVPHESPSLESTMLEVSSKDTPATTHQHPSYLCGQHATKWIGRLQWVLERLQLFHIKDESSSVTLHSFFHASTFSTSLIAASHQQ